MTAPNRAISGACAFALTPSDAPRSCACVASGRETNLRPDGYPPAHQWLSHAGSRLGVREAGHSTLTLSRDSARDVDLLLGDVHLHHRSLSLRTVARALHAFRKSDCIHET